MTQMQEKLSAVPNLPKKVKYVYKGVPSPPFWEGQKLNPGDNSRPLSTLSTKRLSQNLLIYQSLSPVVSPVCLPTICLLPQSPLPLSVTSLKFFFCFFVSVCSKCMCGTHVNKLVVFSPLILSFSD